MKKWLMTLGGIAFVAGVTSVVFVNWSHAQHGLLEDPMAQDESVHPLYRGVKHGPYGAPNAQQGAHVPAAVVTEQPNKDILVTPDVGPWMICLASYEGDRRHHMARQMVAELRGPKYRLPAYVFNYGEDEQRKEAERVKNLRESQIKLLKMTGHRGAARIRIRQIPVKLQTAVLIGGYKDKDTVKRVLKTIKTLKRPDPKRVHLDSTFVFQTNKQNGAGKWDYVNPFKRAFVARNPALPKQQRQARSLDITVLRHLNASEPYSLLKCRKKVTLAVKEFRLPNVTSQKEQPQTSYLGVLPGLTGPTHKDFAGHNARNLAKFLRKSGWKAYVLHTKFSSVVTVGEFNNVNDPRIRVMQQRISHIQQQHPHYARLKLFPVAWPMRVPQ